MWRGTANLPTKASLLVLSKDSAFPVDWGQFSFVYIA